MMVFETEGNPKDHILCQELLMQTRQKHICFEFKVQGDIVILNRCHHHNIGEL